MRSDVGLRAHEFWYCCLTNRVATVTVRRHVKTGVRWQWNPTRYTPRTRPRGIVITSCDQFVGRAFRFSILAQDAEERIAKQHNVTDGVLFERGSRSVYNFGALRVSNDHDLGLLG
jgi:hypothetical protein